MSNIPIIVPLLLESLGAEEIEPIMKYIGEQLNIKIDYNNTETMNNHLFRNALKEFDKDLRGFAENYIENTKSRKKFLDYYHQNRLRNIYGTDKKN